MSSPTCAHPCAHPGALPQQSVPAKPADAPSFASAVAAELRRIYAHLVFVR